MPRSKQYTLTLNYDTDSICTAQQLATAGNLTIDGAKAETIPAGSTARAILLTGHIITLYSAGDLHTVTFTVYGVNQNGASISEAITGPNNSTVSSTNYFKTITRVAASAAVGSDVIVGTAAQAISPTIPMNRYSKANPAVIVTVSGTINYNVDHVVSNIQDTSITQNWYTDITGASDTTDMDEHLPRVVGAVRVVVNSFTNGATCLIDIGDR